MSRVFVTGTAGFIGFHLARLLLEEGAVVHGYDGMTDYYDVDLKRQRNAILAGYPNYSFTEGMLEDNQLMEAVTDGFAPDVIIHLVAQAGVRYSLENPRAYVESNVVGTFNVMEAAKKRTVRHLLMASTSSVYGANEDMPFTETDKGRYPAYDLRRHQEGQRVDGPLLCTPLGIPDTMFRFFTVYGPLGRPDLALYKFVDAILDGRPIDVYNHGEMYCDFTYVGDSIRGIRMLIDNAVPQRPDNADVIPDYDSLSPVAPYRVVNIGNSDKVKLLDFINAIEDAGQAGDPELHADAAGRRARNLCRHEAPEGADRVRAGTNFKDGIGQFVEWYRTTGGSR